MAGSDSLNVFFQDLLRRWKLATAIAAAVLIGASVYASSLPNSYQGRSVVAFSPRTTPQGTLAVGADTLRVVLPRYVAYATSRATLEIVAGRIGEDAGDLVDAVDATVTADSGNVTITVTLGTARRAADAANAVANQTLNFNQNDSVLEGVVVSPALPPPFPSGPPRTLIQIAALLVGIILGIAVALLFERGRPRVRTWRDVGLVTGYQVVGRVPPARALRGSPVEALNDPAVGAAIRTLRTSLERLSRDRPVHVVLVTSSIPGEGKTTVAATLAVALARLDADVLLIDADLRRPGLTKLFDVSATRGLHTVLRGRTSLAQAIQKDSVAGLRLLPTAADSDAGDLLARRFAEVIREARGMFDVVVVDAPPLLGGDDARTLAALCDGVLMVVAADTLAAQASEAAAALDALGVRVLGVVANRARDPRGFSTYGSYGAYGNYGAAAPPAPAPVATPAAAAPGAAPSAAPAAERRDA